MPYTSESQAHNTHKVQPQPWKLTTTKNAGAVHQMAHEGHELVSFCQQGRLRATMGRGTAPCATVQGIFSNGDCQGRARPTVSRATSEQAVWAVLESRLTSHGELASKQSPSMASALVPASSWWYTMSSICKSNKLFLVSSCFGHCFIQQTRTCSVPWTPNNPFITQEPPRGSWAQSSENPWSHTHSYRKP